MTVLLQVLRQPAQLANLLPEQWDALLVMARRTRLLGWLHHVIEAQDLRAVTPTPVLERLDGEQRLTAHMLLLTNRALDLLERQLQGCESGPVVLLKGAAYLALGLPQAGYRRLSDVDVLVEKSRLPAVEQCLRNANWGFDAGISAYDERYYRQWSHELPPLHHLESALELDLHHALIQPTSRINTDAGPLFEQCIPVPGRSFYALAPADMVLHCVTHLFMSDELRGGLRDLVDLRTLCAHFHAQDAGFWSVLTQRADQLNLQRPLYYGLTSINRLLAAQVPAETIAALPGAAPVAAVDNCMARLIDRQLVPVSLDKLTDPRAEQLLFIRSHWLRMPPLMLLRHLSYKAWSGRGGASGEGAGGAG